MMNIPCPWCGPRAHIEFTYGGDATRERPREDASLETWLDYVYVRGNPCGSHHELWHHHAGCRQWFEVQRDTRTHVIAGSAAVAH
jgi:sarcosine oxidase subunit delta